MGTTQFDNSKLGETSVEKNDHFKSTVDQTASKQERMKNGNESEPEIYFLIFHRGRKHEPRGGRRIGLFGPFDPREPKDFGIPHGGPHRTDHPHERTFDKVERSDIRRGPPHAREFRHGPHFMYNPEKGLIDEHIYVPHRRFGPGPHGDSSRHPHRFGPHEHGHRPRGDGFEIKERFHHHPSREHGNGPQGSPHGRFETKEYTRFPYHLPREHGHGPHLRERGFGPRGKFEAEENVKRINSHKNPQSHRHRPHGKLHDPRERFEAEENLKKFYSKHRRHGGYPSLERRRQRNKRGPHDGSPSREHRHSPRGRFEKELRYLFDHLEHYGHDRKFERGMHEPEPDYESDHSNRSFRRRRSSRGFEHSGHGSKPEYESDYSSKSFEYHRDGHRFEHCKRRILGNHGFDSRGERKLSGPRLHRHAHRARHGIFRRHLFPIPPHYSKPLTPEELAEKVALINSMGFTSENNFYYEELLRKFNGRIGHVVDILLREQRREKDDNRKEKDDKRKEKNDEKAEDNEKEKHSENKENYDIIEEADEQF